MAEAQGPLCGRGMLLYMLAARALITIAASSSNMAAAVRLWHTWQSCTLTAMDGVLKSAQAQQDGAWARCWGSWSKLWAPGMLPVLGSTALSINCSLGSFGNDDVQLSQQGTHNRRVSKIGTWLWTGKQDIHLDALTFLICKIHHPTDSCWQTSTWCLVEQYGGLSGGCVRWLKTGDNQAAVLACSLCKHLTHPYLTTRQSTTSCRPHDCGKAH